MPFWSVRLLCAVGAVLAQDLFEKQTQFLARHGSAMQAANPNVTSSVGRLAAKSADSWYKTIGPQEALDNGQPLCIDLPGGTLNNGNNLWLWECNGQDSQIWVFDNFQIRFGLDESYCIDAGDMSNGNQLTLWSCNDQQQQKWGYDGGAQRLFLDGTGTCLDWAEQDYTLGQPLHVWECNDLANQHWSYWDSPDPSGGGGGGQCADCFPSDHCQYDTGVWPKFDDQQSLQNDQYWGPYFQRIYGDIPSTGYPICPGAFQFLWQEGAVATGIVQVTPLDCAPGGGTGQELKEGDWYTGQSFLEARDKFGYIYNTKLFSASVPANKWVEVVHTVFPGDAGAIWYYMAVGSGVWINVGNTQVFDDHPDMVSTLISKTCSDQPQDKGSPTECENNFDDCYQAASSQGLNTIQITDHYDCTCGPTGPSSYKYNRRCATEIIALDDPSGATSGCSSLLKGGWEASSACNCDASVTSSTMDGTTASYANCGAS